MFACSSLFFFSYFCVWCCCFHQSVDGDIRTRPTKKKHLKRAKDLERDGCCCFYIFLGLTWPNQELNLVNVLKFPGPPSVSLSPVDSLTRSKFKKKKNESFLLFFRFRDRKSCRISYAESRTVYEPATRRWIVAVVMKIFHLLFYRRHKFANWT